MPQQSKKKKGGRKPAPVSFGGKAYIGGIPELAAKFDVDVETIRQRRKAGWTWEEAVSIRERAVNTGRKARPVQFGGKSFSGGIPELASKFGLSAELIRSRRNKGWSWEESVGLKVKRVRRSDAIVLTIDGKEYNAAEAARAFGVDGRNPGHTVRNRVKSGWSDRQAVGVDPPPQRSIRKERHFVDGKSYPLPAGHGTVYLITNNVNGRQYVGITASRFEHRVMQYKSDSNAARTTRPIARAMKKYGFKNFRFEVIDTSAKTFPELLALEEKYIMKYGTYKKGYNASAGGEWGGTPITIEGKEYASISIAALAYDLDPSNLRRRVRLGMPPDEAIAFEYRKQLTVNDPTKGEVTGTLTELCDLYSIPFTRAYQRLAKGWTIDEVIGFAKHNHLTVNEPVVVAGKEFSSFRAACDAQDLQYKVAWRRFKERGWTIEQALGFKSPPRNARHGGQKVKVGKRTFRTKTAAQKALNISYEKLVSRIADGTYKVVD